MLKKIMRLALTPLLVLGLTFSGFGMAFASPEPEEELSEIQIREKLDEINDRYELGEELSEEDASFVMEHFGSPSEKSVQPMSSFHKTYSGSYGSVEGFGFIKGDIGYFGGSFNGLINVQTPDLSKRSSLGVEVRVSAYGILGSGGVGKIFDRTYTETNKDVNYISHSFGDSISGVGVSATAYSFVGYVDGNSFNLYEN
ncbi:Uncharacterised protein [Actinobacillus pleuropneumoniae]|jgi:hypothetical protein|nr:Uncharacterised protein [Actinobacillus pleuropneumoniae]